MSKRNKSIEVEIRETDRNKGQVTDLEVVIKKKVIGTIHQDSAEGPVSVSMSSGKNRQVKSIDEAIEVVISEYNLHDL